MSQKDGAKRAIADTAFKPFRNGEMIRGVSDGYDVNPISDFEIVIRVPPMPGNGPRYFKIKVSEVY